jgi:oligoribonuclease NrnB/cAMP/cGMP phosphodiesterase (DHH superfamily)
MNKEKLDRVVLVAYHANCIDGYTAAWVAHTKLIAEGEKVEFLPMTYNDLSYEELLHEVKSCNPKELYILDFSLPMETLEKLCKEYNETEVILLDHHKTAFERYSLNDGPFTSDSKLEVLIWGAGVRLDMSKSGAGLAWDYFNTGLPRPAIVNYVEDYDLWKFEMGDETRYINKYLSYALKNMDIWTAMAHVMENNLFSALEQGKVLYDRFIDKVDELVQDAVHMTLGDFQCLAVQCEGSYTNEVGNRLAKKEGIDIGLTYRIDGYDATIKWSARSIGDIDVSTLAANFGGGGHKNAAGFTTTLLALTCPTLPPTKGDGPCLSLVTSPVK